MQIQLSRPLSVLIADESARLADAVREVVMSWGFEAGVVLNESDAVAALRSNKPPDVILLNLDILRVDGDAGLLGSRPIAPAHRPWVVAVSGDELTAGRGARPGVDQFLATPYDVEDLRRVLNERAQHNPPA
jgi:DNA-binding response OmpR family regulator